MDKILEIQDQIDRIKDLISVCVHASLGTEVAVVANILHFFVMTELDKVQNQIRNIN